jgi:DNA-directed RNA polymerase subunit alpha
MTITGVLEDVTDIILNVKSLIIKLDGEGPKTMTVARQTKGEVKADDIEADPAITVINRDLVLATLTDKIDFKMEMQVASGRGYVTASENAGEGDQEIGVIPVDSLFSPVTRVRYQTEDTRVGQKVNYDRLVMAIWTKGTITPDMALVEAAKILRKHLNPFVQFAELGVETVAVEGVGEEGIGPVMDEAMRQKLDMSIQELDLSVRATNCLEAASISTLGELVQKAEADLLKVRSFGKTSLREVKRKLTDLGLSLGMTIPQTSAG